MLDDASLARGEALWRLSVPAISGAIELPGRQFIEWNGAQRWWKTAAPAAQIRDAAARAGGHATLMRGADKSCGVRSGGPAASSCGLQAGKTSFFSNSSTASPG